MTATYTVPPILFKSEKATEQAKFHSIILSALNKVLQRHAALEIGIKGEERP